MEYKSLINKISTHLKSLGWKKYNNTFFIEKDNNFGVINFQKSLDNTINTQKFTINIGVISNYILEHLNKKSKHPNIWECHWRERVGFLLSKPEDLWWDLKELQDISSLTNNIIDLLDSLAIPKILEHINDNALERYWGNGLCGWLTDFERNKYLKILQSKKKNETI